MFRCARSFLISLTTCAVFVVSLAAGHARGQAPVAGQIVICHGLTMITIQVDAEGQPTTAHHICPDAVLHFADTVADASHAVVRPVVAEEIWLQPIALAVPGLSATGIRTRAPPLAAA